MPKKPTTTAPKYVILGVENEEGRYLEGFYNSRPFFVTDIESAYTSFNQEAAQRLATRFGGKVVRK